MCGMRWLMQDFIAYLTDDRARTLKAGSAANIIVLESPCAKEQTWVAAWGFGDGSEGTMRSISLTIRVGHRPSFTIQPMGRTIYGLFYPYVPLVRGSDSPQPEAACPVRETSVTAISMPCSTAHIVIIVPKVRGVKRPR